jgi:hypothetical protein
MHGQRDTAPEGLRHCACGEVAPDIVEAVMTFKAVGGSERVAEQTLRKLVHERTWANQREVWSRLRKQSGK